MTERLPAKAVETIHQRITKIGQEPYREHAGCLSLA